jgi:hypothetical protein
LLVLWNFPPLSAFHNARVTSSPCLYYGRNYYCCYFFFL